MRNFTIFKMRNFVLNKFVIYTILFFGLSTNVFGFNKIAYSINNQIITTKDINNRIAMMKIFSQSAVKQIPHDQLVKLVTNSLISEILLSSEIENAGNNISQEEINFYIKNLENSQKMPQDYFRNVFKHYGINFKTFSNYVKNEIIKSKIASTHFKNANISEESLLTNIILTDKKNLPVVQMKMIEFPTKNKDKILSLIKNKNISTINTQEFKNSGGKIININKNITSLDNKYLGFIINSSIKTYSQPMKIDNERSVILFVESKKINLDKNSQTILSNNLATNKALVELGSFIDGLKGRAIFVMK